MLTFLQYIKEQWDDGAVSAYVYNGKLYHGKTGREHHHTIMSRILDKHKIPSENQDKEAEKMEAHYYHPKLRRTANVHTAGLKDKDGNQKYVKGSGYQHKFKYTKFHGEVEKI